MTPERFGRIVEDALSEVYVFSAEDFRFILVNQGARENLGFSVDELRKLAPWDVYPEFDQATFREMLVPLLSGEKPRLDFETAHQRKDGTRYDVHVRLQLMRSDGEEIFYASVEDISERKRMDLELKRSSARFDAILDNTRMAVFLMDERQQCVFMNTAAEKLTGYSLEETQGRALHDVVHHTYPDGRPFPIEECAIDRAFPEENQTEGEEVFVHKDGHFYPVGFTASPIRDEGRHTIGTVIEVREISDELEARKALEDFNRTLATRVDEALAERDRLSVQLVQAQKMEAVGQLTGGISHDFNNLLQVIGGNLQLLQKELSDGDPKHARVQNALSGVDRGAKLAAQLLAFGRRQALEPKPINIARLVRDMDELLRRTLGEAVETVVAGGLWNCLADPVQVENVILNLAINARDAMNAKGKLTIEAGNASLDDDYVKIHPDVTAGQYVMLAVTDTGTGISSDVIGKVFDPFFTTKGPEEGTGLGLSMVYGFVKQSDGHIKIYSEPGQGTTVRIYLPRTRREEQAEPVEYDFDHDAVGDETILVVEDDDEVRATTVALLTDIGYTVFEASDADAALAIVNSGLKLDLLFTDVIMPGNLRSPDVAQRAKEKLPGIGVLFTSGYTQNAIVHAGRLDEGVALISKPYTRERLARKIREVLDGRQTVPFPIGSPSEPEVAPSSSRDTSSEVHPLRILIVEDEVIIRMTTSETLSELGHEVLQAGSVSEARRKLVSENFEVMIADLGLPDGSGLDLIQETLRQKPEVAVIVASGGDFDIVSGESDLELVRLRKPYDDAALKAALKQCVKSDD